MLLPGLRTVIAAASLMVTVGCGSLAPAVVPEPTALPPSEPAQPSKPAHSPQPAPDITAAPEETLAEETLAEEALAEETSDTPPGAGGTSLRVLDNGLGIDDLHVGSGAEATDGSRIEVHYVGTLQDGTVFDSSRTRGTPFVFVLGEGRTIEGWEQGLVGMRVGGLRRLIIPPHLGYGARGAGATIPPHAYLEFEVELLSVE